MKGLLRIIPLVVAVAVVAALRAPAPLAAQARAAAPDANRNFDARIAYNATYRANTAVVATAAPQTFAVGGAAARVTVDDRTGTVRTVSMPGGYLTPAAVGADPMQVSLRYVTAQATALGLDSADLADYETTDVVSDRATGAIHIYLRQRHLGVPLYNGQLQINVNRDGRILSVNNAFHPGLAAAVNTSVPGIDAAVAADALARHLGVAAGAATASAPAASAARTTRVDAPALSRTPIDAHLMWLTIRRGVARLVWNFQVSTLDHQHVYDVTVDAASGEVWTRFDWAAADVYTVYPRPVESPQHTAPAPPADARVDVSAPAHPIASPFGWHDTNGIAGAEYTIMRGNNVHAYDDIANLNAPPGVEPDCGPSLLCRFALDLTQAPSTYTAAAVANLFYWNNIVHDVQYQYGFTEVAGNFQVHNYGRGGLGADDVQAEAQDGGGVNNANFVTPPDGSQPRMQMYLWTPGGTPRDGDLDAGIIVHEYGHGISNRLVGGPSNTSCLANPQQPGEGLSDWWALVYTAKAGDTALQGRGVGTYVYGDPANGLGIRTRQYSTDPTINSWTYESINGMAVPHGVGSVWAEAAWRMYWALVNQHGFSADLANAAGTAGNQRAMLYVNAGLMNTACSPTFLDVRDGILQAAADNHGGEDVCRIWSAFASMGLGVNALSGGPESTTPINGFAVPLSCGGSPVAPVFGVQPSDTHVHQGYAAQFTVPGGAGGNPAPTYQWEYSGDDGVSWSTITNGAPYSGALTASLTVSAVPEALHGARYRLRASNVAGVAVTSDARLTLANSRYDAALGTLVCALASPACLSGSLFMGRDTLTGGNEPNQPNTLGGSCADHTVGAYGADESIDKLSVSTTDGTLLRPGKSVRVDVTVFSYSPTGDRLDLFHATNPTTPSWTYLTRLRPAGPGAQRLSHTFTLPTGSGALQAVRAKFSWVGDTTPCEAPTPGKFFTDYDDLVFSTTSQFADDPVVAGVTTVKKVHLDELRARINWLRTANGLPARSFTDAVVTAGATVIQAAHLTELRSALAEVYAAIHVTSPTYTDPVLGVTTAIRAVHLNELRAAILAIER